MTTKKLNEDIVIESKFVNGLRNPLIEIYGHFTNDMKEIYLESKGKKIDSKMIIISPKKNRFCLKAKVSRSDRKVYLILVNGKNKEKVAVINNNIFIRMHNKLSFKYFSKIGRLLKKVFGALGRNIKFLWKEYHFIIPKDLRAKYREEYKRKIRRLFNKETYNPFKNAQYNKWIKEHEEQTVYKELKYKPLISILIPVYNISRKYLSECLDSILAQHYENFEVCLADDCSTSEETLKTLKEYEEKDKRIRVVYRKENGHISKATNSALDIAKGEFIALMDDDDVLTPNALYEMVKVLNENKNYDFIYSDEDKMTEDGVRCHPHFKPNFSPDSFMGCNYICHFEIFRTSLMRKIGGFRSEYVGAQDFDLFLRLIEQTTPERIYHIPKILYHWRMVEGSTAVTIESKEYAIENGRKAVEDHFKRLGKDVTVTAPITSAYYLVNYNVRKEPLVSIIIPTKDLADKLDVCLNSIYTKTTYKNYEVIVVDNRSEEKETFELFEKYKKKYKNFKVVKADMEFNYSKINNLAVKESKGDYLLFLNNDTEVITKEWITNMVGYAKEDHIGAVGVELLYPDNTIQHAGVVLSKEVAAHHAFLKVSYENNGYAGRLLVPYNYSAVTAACLMVSRKKFNEVKGFEEKLKVAYNDIDFCLKLLDKGYYNIFLPQVNLYHYESLSRGLDTTTEKYELFLKEKAYLMNKWKKYIDNDPYYNPNLSDKYTFMLDR